jgi:enoyl-CoA hydratase/carnithine racemase
MRAQCDSQDSPVWRIRLQPGEQGEIVLSAQGLDELIALLGAAERSSRCRLVALEGSDGTFCRGMDLDAAVADPSAHAAAGPRQLAECLRALRGSGRVVVALVDGVVLAGGVGLAAAADLVLATRSSTFGLPEVVVGLVPAIVLPLLLERMPAQKARRFCLRGTSIDAEQAREWGLVDRLVESAADLERAFRTVAKQVLRLEPEAVRELKRWCDRAAALPRDEAIADGAVLSAELIAEPERARQLAAFLDGEPLPWFERYRPPGDPS